MQVNGRKALVFGGTSGIGLATTKLLADKGCDVVAISRQPKDIPGGWAQNVTFEPCDVRDREALQELFTRHAPFDILVSTATGGERVLQPFRDMDLDGFVGSFDKLWGYANVVRLGLEHLPDDGAIVLVSGSPARRCNPKQVALSAVGGAVEAMVRGIAKEITPIRINTLSPGLIDTPIVTLQDEARNAHYAKLTEKNLIARAGAPEECAMGIVFLIENDFVTGTTIDVDGGILLS